VALHGIWTLARRPTGQRWWRRKYRTLSSSSAQTAGGVFNMSSCLVSDEILEYRNESLFESVSWEGVSSTP
jgi:hypothetical protein